MELRNDNIFLALVPLNINTQDRQRIAVQAYLQASDMLQWAIIDQSLTYELTNWRSFWIDGKPFRKAVWFIQPGLIIERAFNNTPDEPGSITRPLKSLTPYLVRNGELTERFTGRADCGGCPFTRQIMKLSISN